MKIFGKKIPKGNILLFLSFTTISICTILVISAMRAEKNNYLSKNAMYSGHQKGFSVAYSENEKEWEEVIPQLAEEYNDFAVYVPVDDKDKIIRGVYIKGKIKIPPMAEGEYFDELSSWSDKPYAVLGKEYEKDVFIKNGIKYYNYNDKDYEVLGIMGTKEENRLNHMMLIDFRSAAEIAGINTEYILDAKKESDLINVGEDIYMHFSLPAEVFINLNKPEETSWVTRLFAGDTIMDTMQVMVLISFLLSTVIVTLIWLGFRRQLLFAYELCGYSPYAEFTELAKRFYLNAGVSFAAGLCIIFALTDIIVQSDIVFTDILKAFGITVGMGTLILLFCYVVYGRRKALLQRYEY